MKYMEDKITDPCWPHTVDNLSFAHEHQHHHNARDSSNKHMKDTLRSWSLLGIHELVVDWGHFAGRHSPSHPNTAQFGRLPTTGNFGTRSFFTQTFQLQQ